MDDLFPLSIYIYELDGLHGNPIRINSESQLKGPGVKLMLDVAMQQKKEIVITDPGDLTVFHAKNGKVLFDGEGHHAE